MLELSEVAQIFPNVGDFATALAFYGALIPKRGRQPVMDAAISVCLPAA